MKIVLNKDYGGFSLPREYCDLCECGCFDFGTEERLDPDLIKEKYRLQLDNLTTESLAEVESHEEYSILDKARRVQISQDALDMAGIDSNKVRVEVKDGKIIISKFGSRMGALITTLQLPQELILLSKKC